MPFKFTNPLSSELMQEIVTLEAKFGTKEGFNFEVVIASHLQLLAIAIVALSEGDYEKVPVILKDAKVILDSLVTEQIEMFAKSGLVKNNGTVQ